MLRVGSNALRVLHIPEPKLEFAYGQKVEYPRDGLYMFGPVSAGEVPEADYGVIGTPEGVSRFEKWAARVAQFIDVPEKKRTSKATELHHVPFPGFSAAFSANWRSKPRVRVDDILGRDLETLIRIDNRHEAIKRTVDVFVDRLREAQDRLERPPAFWFVVIPEIIYSLGRPQASVPASERVKGDVRIREAQARRLSTQPSLFEEDEIEAEVYKYAKNFRRQLKARLLEDRIVTQIVRETTLAPLDFLNAVGQPIRRIEDPATVAWKLTTAAYYKSGGRPWQLAEVRPGVCYVGLVYKQMDESSDSKYACCAAQMFLSNGDGVVFRGALGPWYSPEIRQFHLDAGAAARLISTVTSEYRRMHGANPKELFIHARSAFNNVEWDGFQGGCPDETKLVGVQVRDAYDQMKLFRRSEYPVIRSTAVELDERAALLWTAGYVPRLDTYMGPETPNPISVRVLRGECDLATVLSDIHALTKINFNSCLFNDRLPVTIRFADAIGDVIVSAPQNSEAKLVVHPSFCNFD